MVNANLYLFGLLNAGANPASWQLYLAIFVAKYVIYILPILWIVGWLWGSTKQRSALLFALTASILAMVINFSIAQIWFHPRPFVLGIGHTYLYHAPDSSFPSDHVTLMWAFGLSFLVCHVLRKWGWTLLVLGVFVGLARIYLGIHYPFDIIGAMIVAALSVLVLSYLRPLLEQKVLPFLETIYRKAFAPVIKKKWIKE